MLRMRTMSHIGTGGWVCLHPGTPEDDTQRYAWAHSLDLYSSLRSVTDRVESAKPHLGHRWGHHKQTPTEACLTKEQYRMTDGVRRWTIYSISHRVNQHETLELPVTVVSSERVSGVPPLDKCHLSSRSSSCLQRSSPPTRCWISCTQPNRR